MFRRIALAILVGAVAVAAPATASASSVGSPMVSMTSTAAGATEVNYLVTFTATGALAGNSGTITLAAPSGTVFASGSGLDVFDLTTDTDLGLTSGPVLANGGAAARWTVGNAGIPAGHRVRVTAFAVTNPAAGTYTLGVLTSADTTPVATGSYAVAAAGAVGTPSVSMSSPAAGATSVNYRIGFLTSSTGGLAGNEGTITVAAPAGTVLPTGVGVDVYDLSDHHDLGFTSGPTLSNSGATATWTVNGNGVPAGKQILVTLTGVTNPAATSGAISVSTSSNTVPVQSAVYTISAASAVSSINGGITSVAAGASGVTYRLEYSASATGALVGNHGTITVAGPTGTRFPAGVGIDVFDLSTAHDLGATSSATLTNAGATATWTVNGNGVPAGQRIRLTITGVTNAPVGIHVVTITTSSDTVPARSVSYPTVAPRGVTQPLLSLLTPAAGAQHVTYLLSFTTSGVGGLAGGGNGSVTVSAPAGTVFSSSTVLTAYDATTNASLGQTFAPTLSNGGATATWGIKDAAWPAGHQIELTIPGVTNPAAATGYKVTISTSSDTVLTTTAPYAIAAPGAVASPNVALTTSATNAIGVTYTVDFTTSAFGALADGAGTITVDTPTGTAIPNQGIDIVDLSTGADLGPTSSPTLANGGATATWEVGTGLAAGDRYELTIAGVVNPSAGTALQVMVSTSSDTVPAATPTYAIIAPENAFPGSVGLTNSLHNASSTYVLTVTTSFDGALADGAGTITVAAPSGTVIPNQGIDIFNLSTDTDIGSTRGPTLSNGGATATWTLGGGVPANTTIQLTITGVTNPAAGSYHLVVATSSDMVPASSGTYTIT